MKNIISSFIFFLIFFWGSHVQAQLDTLFWFVAPEVIQSHGDRPIVFRFATLNTPANVTISQPANALFTPQTINLASNSAQTIDLTAWIDMVENKPADQILNFGFKIVSSAPIMAYYEVTPTCNCNPDIFTLKGKSSLGTSFVVPFQNFLSNAYGNARSGFDIVATENNTTITITPKQNIVGHLATIPFLITLNAGETFSAQAIGSAANQHLSGSTVNSNRPIAITINDDSMSGAPYGGCADLMGDQIIPNSVLGKEHIAIKGYLNGPDKVYVVASLNNTEITIDGIVVAVINATEMYVHTLVNPTAYIISDKPTHVLHTSGFGCEVGGAILPPIVCTGSTNVAFVRSTSEFFALNILVPSGGENSFVLNGSNTNITAANFQVVPGTGGQWMFAQINASGFIPVQQASRIENPNVKFHMGVIHGGASSGCRYGYFSDFASLQYSIQSQSNILCSGDTLLLFNDSLPGATYNWSGPNNINIVGNTLNIPNIQSSNSGNYVISGYLPGECALLSDTISISVINVPNAPAIYNNGPICNGDTLSFWTDENSNYEYLWTDAFGNSFTNDTIWSTQTQNDIFPVNLTVNIGACISEQSINTAIIFNKPTITYIGDTAICGNTVNLSSTNTIDPLDQINQISWLDLDNNNTILGIGENLSNIQSPINPYHQHNYVVEIITLNGCIGVDTFLVTFLPSPDLTMNANLLCDGETAVFSSSSTWANTPPPNSNLTYVFAFGDGQTTTSQNPTHIYANSGTYLTSITATTNEGCVTSETLEIELISVPLVEPIISTSCGQNANFSLDLTLENYVVDSLVWSIPSVLPTNSSTFNHQFVNAGIYIGNVQLFGENNCNYSFPINFTIIPSITIDKLVIPNVITPNNDQKNDSWEIDQLFKNCEEFDLIILNRWGNVVFETKNGTTPFSGYDVDGKKLTPGVYFYKVSTKDNTKTGHISIVHD
jgi:gliding motility-associated-like protein